LQFLKRSARARAKVSLILLDWSVRESFHLLHYLEKQTVERDLFEVIVVEYYSRVSDALRPFAAQVDTWVLLEIPEHCYYHKHLMYNAGIALARGEIVMIGDSDAMVRETFIETILETFREDPQVVFHIDQFRNQRRDLYPFSYPTFETVLGEGCSNHRDGRTIGLCAENDAIHLRNYGACMCARRESLIAIGGADMHADYLGHVCGPYEMTFRLVNHGLREIWSEHEFMYHTWHPGQAGAANHIGPHDGRHVSTTALEALVSGRIRPLVEHPILARLRSGSAAEDELTSALVPAGWTHAWSTKHLEQDPSRQWAHDLRPMGTYRGHRLVMAEDRVLAFPIPELAHRDPAPPARSAVCSGPDLASVRESLRQETPALLRPLASFLVPWTLASRSTRAVVERARLHGPLARSAVGVLAAALAPALLLVVRLTSERGVFGRLHLLRIRAAADAEQLADLALGLGVLAKQGSVPARSLLLVELPSELRILRGLQVLGVMPAIATRRAASTCEVREALAAARPADRVFMPATTFTRFHGSAAEAEIRERVTPL
jgi:hypothetical protein